MGSGRTWQLVLGLVVLVAALGCDKKKPPPPVAAPVVAAPAAGAADPVIKDAVAETALSDTYIYTPVGKRDPFKSAYKDTSGKPRELEGPVGPLQRFEIDQLKLVAVISGISQPRAMITLPDGKGYTVKIGTRIGKNYGRVVRIKTSEVIIAEDYRDWNGRKVTNYIHMTLRKDEKK
jgi:type IV pilus assembly protein PilP